MERELRIEPEGSDSMLGAVQGNVLASGREALWDSFALGELSLQEATLGLQL